MTLPRPSRRLGYTEAEVLAILKEHGRTEGEWWKWFNGQTGGVDTDGTLTYYPWDVERFLERSGTWD